MMLERWVKLEKFGFEATFNGLYIERKVLVCANGRTREQCLEVAKQWFADAKWIAKQDDTILGLSGIKTLSIFP